MAMQVVFEGPFVLECYLFSMCFCTVWLGDFFFQNVQQKIYDEPVFLDLYEANHWKWRSSILSPGR
jgi:hypothetical protein